MLDRRDVVAGIRLGGVGLAAWMAVEGAGHALASLGVYQFQSGAWPSVFALDVPPFAGGLARAGVWGAGAAIALFASRRARVLIRILVPRSPR